MFEEPHPEGFSHISRMSLGVESSVFTAIHDLTHVKTIVKCFQMAYITENGLEEKICSEMQIHRTLKHPFIAYYFGSSIDESYVYYFLEYFPAGTLLNRVNNIKMFKEEEAQRIFCELASAIKYLHKYRNVVHRDIKLDNIMLTNSNDIALIDFGFSRCGGDIYSTLCGSFPYAAPELIKGQPYTSAVDIWSSGVVLFALLTGHLPFKGNNQQIIKQIQFSEPQYPEMLSASAIDLLSHLLDKDPKTRYSIDEIETHPWVHDSPYSYYLTECFIGSNTEISISNESLSKVDSIGYDATEVQMQLIEDVESPGTILYRILCYQHDRSIPITLPKSIRNSPKPRFYTQPIHLDSNPEFKKCLTPAKSNHTLPTLISTLSNENRLSTLSVRRRNLDNSQTSLIIGIPHKKRVHNLPTFQEA